MRYEHEVANFNLKPALWQQKAKSNDDHLEQNAEQKVSPQMMGRFGRKRGLHKKVLNFQPRPVKQNHRLPGRRFHRPAYCVAAFFSTIGAAYL
jgi:hypothetical protein